MQLDDGFRAWGLDIWADTRNSGGLDGLKWLCEEGATINHGHVPYNFSLDSSTKNVKNITNHNNHGAIIEEDQKRNDLLLLVSKNPCLLFPQLAKSGNNVPINDNDEIQQINGDNMDTDLIVTDKKRKHDREGNWHHQLRLDHFPILLKLSQHYQTRKAKRFHFENSWLEEEELSHVVNEALTISTSQAIISKLHTCVDKLDNWGRQIHFCFIWDIDSNSAGTKWLQTLHFS
ncbi:hypothetical protein JHK82_055852 [Glycine max]|nr:hypothetical protein JHK86_055675 [Glycine max]KAG4909827.1 hypothetical protein JHK87_055943 [Glycine soja]KAG4918400.1 hypothetical protein JHK85_056681 [Glycine max]KAG5077157.1 hypothetical protein JHK82_055852 [Glycine max]